MLNRPCVLVVDSGIGGLSLLRTCRNVCCDFVFVMDNAFCPYGEKSPDVVVSRIKTICEYFVATHSVCAIVLACNTATSVAIEQIRKCFSVPIIGMEPPIKTAISDNKKNIVVMSTPITNKFSKVVGQYKSKKEVRLVSFCDLAKKIEQNFFHLNNLKEYIRGGFSEQDLKGCDALVLGCSHFQYVEKELREIFQNDIVVYHSEQGVRRRLIEILGGKIQPFGNAKIAIVQTQFDESLLTIAKEILCK
ncbi:MAG: glutamate racemase [Christensenellales bacterium]